MTESTVPNMWVVDPSEQLAQLKAVQDIILAAMKDFRLGLIQTVGVSEEVADTMTLEFFRKLIQSVS